MLPGKDLDLSKKKRKNARVIHLTLIVTSYCSLVVSYPRRHRQTREDAASTSHTSPLLLSGCLGRRCPRCIERTPEHIASTSICFFTRQSCGKNKTLTCLVFAFPKFLMYMSYSFTGGRSKMETVVEKSSSISRSSSALRFLEPQQNSSSPYCIACFLFMMHRRPVKRTHFCFEAACLLTSRCLAATKSMNFPR